MKLTINYAVCIITSLSLAGCTIPVMNGNGIVKTENRKIEGTVKSVEIANGFKFDYKINKEAKNFDLVITMDSNLLPVLETTVSNGNFIIKEKAIVNFYTKKELVVTGPAVERLELSGGSDGNIDNFTTDVFQVELTGGAKLKLSNFSANSFTSDLSGGSKLTLAGKVKNYTINGSGGSQIFGEAFETDFLKIDFSGGSKAEMKVNTDINGSLSGGSMLTYSGSPKITENSSGGAKVTKK